MFPHAVVGMDMVEEDVGPGAQRHSEAVKLPPGEDIAGDLGGLTQTDGQHAGGQWIETSHMARLVGAKHAAGFLECGV